LRRYYIVKTESSVMDRNSDRRNTGTFIGSCTESKFREVFCQQDILLVFLWGITDIKNM
jgi:hypothetical protein